MLSDDDHRTIADAIRAAERRSGAEIVCVVARSASDYSAVPVLWAALLALSAPWPLIAMTAWSVTQIFSVQIALFMAATVVFSWRPVRMALVPGAVKRARAHRAAGEQFLARGLTRTRSRRGLLVFVALAERYARIVTDAGVAAVVPDPAWRPVVDDLVAHLSHGDVVAGLVGAVTQCGDRLAPHLPPAPAENELPDRLYVI